jgi:hypothetical protein
VIIMQYVKGKQAWGAWRQLTDVQFADVCSQLEEYVKQLRKLSPPSFSQVSSTCGGPCRDHRFGRLPIGPFETHDDFHHLLRENASLDQYTRSHPHVVECIAAATFQNSLTATLPLEMSLMAEVLFLTFHPEYATCTHLQTVWHEPPVPPKVSSTE